MFNQKPDLGYRQGLIYQPNSNVLDIMTEPTFLLQILKHCSLLLNSPADGSQVNNLLPAIGESVNKLRNAGHNVEVTFLEKNQGNNSFDAIVLLKPGVWDGHFSGYQSPIQLIPKEVRYVEN